MRKLINKPKPRAPPSQTGENCKLDISKNNQYSETEIRNRYVRQEGWHKHLLKTNVEQRDYLPKCSTIAMDVAF